MTVRIINMADRKNPGWSLQEGIYVVGRSRDCELYIDDDTISRKHARIEIDGSRTIRLTDLESYNGTLVNGKRLSGTMEVKHRDILTLGRVQLKILAEKRPQILTGLSAVYDPYSDLSSATILTMNEALGPLPSRILENPEVFKAISEIGKMLVVPGDDRQMLEKSVELLQSIIPSERIAILLTGESADDIHTALFRVAGEKPGGSFSISSTILNEVLSQKKAVLISDTSREEKFAEQQSIISSRINSAMAVPLYDEGKISGILYIDTSNPAHHYTEDYIRIAATFSNILAAKMANNILLNERRAKEILESELAYASRIQKRLLPEILPEINGYKIEAFQIQCEQVGGDLYDVARLEDGKVIFIIADVSGKGMGAALLASNILAAFRALYNSENFSLLEAVRNVSDQLLAFTRSGDYATLFVGLLDPVDNKLRFVNSGHNPPLAIRGGKIEFLEASGIPIGMMKFDQWKEDSIDFNNGDTVLAFTDGIPEALNSDGVQFSDERLQELAVEFLNKEPRQIIDAILEKVYEFIGKQPRSDDITMIVFKRDP